MGISADIQFAQTKGTTMTSIYTEATGRRRDKSRTFESKRQTLERRITRLDKYGVDSRKAGRR